jgi:hypothetical protein
VNPYVSFGIAMCLVVGIALFFTAYLAVVFNRRAKRDLEATLTPLAELLGGGVDLEEATAAGRFGGHIATGRAANAPDGPGKVFYAALIDAAGGAAWTYTIRRPKDAAAPIETKFEGPTGPLGERLHALADGKLRPLMTVPGWLRLEYDPAPGHVRLARPMVTRRDIPAPGAFMRQLELVREIADANRAIQQGATA